MDDYRKHTVENNYIHEMLSHGINESNETNGIHYTVATELDLFSDIDCNVISVSGLDFAIANSCIKNVVNQQDIELTMKADFAAGSILKNGCIYKVIDISLLINPDYRKYFIDNKVSKKNMGVIFLKHVNLGILFENQKSNKTIAFSDVCWRPKNSDRKWLAGTVKEHNFSLLDLAGILKLVAYER